MWYPPGDFTTERAQLFLKKDFIKNIERTKYLYVETAPKKGIGLAYFEPVLLCLTWCDFLGALYCGDGREHKRGGLGSSARSKNFIADVLAQTNIAYVNAAEELVGNYRNGLIHGYAPDKFEIEYDDAYNHLKCDGGATVIHVPKLIDDMLSALEFFSRALVSRQTGWGSLQFFNKGRHELLTGKIRYLNSQNT